MVSHILGGLGMFLLGMTLMTDGLKAFAGRALRNILGRWVTGPGTGLFWGLVATAIVQSSSATTVTAIGFVGSGIMTFSQAVGVIFGANLGTTTTGWLVAIFGLKYSIVSLAYPLVVIGAGMKLLGRERTGALGLALCGFSLIFIGIDHLQLGMQSLSDDFSFEAFSPEGFGGRIALVAVGSIMTVVMQSSSAAMATVLTALHAGALGFEQGAAMIIGQNIGTTVTAGVAAIGGSASARRTALAHVLFNVMTACIAFLLLPIIVSAALWITGWFDGDSATISLAAFHTIFNLLGVGLFFPIVSQYAAFISRLIPEKKTSLVRPLDNSLLEMPHLALDAARRTLMNVMGLIADGLNVILNEPERRPELLTMLDEADQALIEARGYLARVNPPTEEPELHATKVGALHALDHLIRMSEDCRDESALESLGANDEIRGYVGSLRTTLSMISMAMKNGDPLAAMKMTEEMSVELAGARRRQRSQIFEATASGQITPADGIGLVESMRWIDRLGYHAWRTLYHLRPVGVLEGTAQNEVPAESEPHGKIS